jgi:hypothetical protein
MLTTSSSLATGKRARDDSATDGTRDASRRRVAGDWDALPQRILAATTWRELFEVGEGDTSPEDQHIKARGAREGVGDAKAAGSHARYTTTPDLATRYC